MFASFPFPHRPLTLNSLDSPYCESYWAGAGLVNVRERQRLEELMTQRYRDAKEPHSLEDEPRDDLMDEEIYREQQAAMSPEQRERQQQAMDERVELDKQKKEVGEWRVKHNQRRLKREEQQQQQQLVRMPVQLKKPKIAKPVFRKRYVNPPMEPLLPPLPTIRETVHIVPKPKRWHQQELEEQDAKGDLEEEQYHNENETDCNDISAEDEGDDDDDDDGNGNDNNTPHPEDDPSSAVNEKLHDLFVQRLNFQAQCGRSNLYNNCQLFSE